MEMGAYYISAPFTQFEDSQLGRTIWYMKNVFLRVSLFCGLFAVQCCVTVLGSVARDTLFLRVYDSRYISHMVLIMSFATAYASTAVSQFQQKGVKSSTIACAFPLISCAVMLSFWVFLSQATSYLYITSIFLYMWIEISGQLLAQQFWDVCAGAFSVSESKQYFGAITFGSTIGTLIASFGLIPMMQKFQVSTEGSVAVVAALQGMIGVAMFSVTPLFQSPPTKAAPSTKSSGSVISELKSRPYLKHVCFFEFGATVIRVFVDYSTLSILGQYPEETVKYALGTINGVQSFIMMPLQLLSGPLFTYFGVMYGISTLPFAVVLFGCATYTSSSYLILIGCRAMYNSVTYAIFNPARELLWLPLNALDRSRFKSFVTGPFRSFARVLGALLSMALTSDIALFYFGSTGVSLFIVLLGATWFVDALVARQSYAGEFYSSLKKGHMDVTSHLIDFTTDQVELVQKTLHRNENDRIAFVVSFIQPIHVPLFYKDLRDVFFRNNSTVLTLPTKLKLLQLHVAYKKQKYSDDAYSIFQFDDIFDLYRDQELPRQLRLAAMIACGYDNQKHLESLRQCLEAETDVSLKIGAAIAVLRMSQWMDEKSTILLQKMLHEPPDVKAKVICLRIVGKELPELLGNGYLVYLLHQSQESRIVHAALECCRQSKRTSAMLVPALIKWLGDANFRAEALDALTSFPPSIIWDNLVVYLESGLDGHNFEVIFGGIRFLEMGQFPADAKLEFVLNMMESLMEIDGLDVEPLEMNLSHALHLSHRLRLWELLVDAMLRAATEAEALSSSAVSPYKRLDKVVTAFIFRGYQLNYLKVLIDGQIQNALLPQVLECTLDNLLRVVLKMVSTKFPKGFNVHVIIEGLHSDVPEVLSAVQEVLETLLRSTVKHTLLPLLFPLSPKAPAALQLEKDVRELQTQSVVELIENAIMDSNVDVELSCLALEQYLGLISKISKWFVLPEEQARRLANHTVTREIILRALSCPSTEKAKVLQHVFQCIKLPSDQSTEAIKVPLTIFEVVTSLRTCALFRSINVIELVQQIASHFSQLTVASNTNFVVEGETATNMYIIASGSVKLHHSNGSHLATLNSGACVGELALLTSKGTYLTSATAISDCILLAISRPSLNTLIQSSPTIARGVVDALASSLKWYYYQTGANSSTVETSRLKRLVSQVTMTANVDKAASALLSKIGRQRNRSKSESPPKESQKVMQKEPLVRSQSKSSLRDHSSIRLDMQHFPSRDIGEIQYTHLEKCLHLKASFFMKDMDDEQIAVVAQMAQVVILPHGEVLYKDGSPATSMFVVVEGTVACTALNEDGEVQKELFQSGDSFGEISFSRGATHISTATAETQHMSVVLLEIPAPEFIELAEKNIKLLHLVLAWLSRKISAKMNFQSDFQFPLSVGQTTSPIGSPRNSPRRGKPPQKMWSEDLDDDSFSTIRQRQKTI